MISDLRINRCKLVGIWNSSIPLLWYEAPFTRCFFYAQKNWFCSSRVEQWAVNSKVVSSNLTRIATDFVAQLERAFAYEAKGWRFESFQNHTSSLEREQGLLVLLANLPDCLSGETGSKCFAFTKSFGKIAVWVIPYKPQGSTPK